MQLLYLGPPETVDHVRANLPRDIDVHLALDEDAVDSVLASCSVVLDAYMGVRFTAERLAKAENLQLFVTATTGADHIDAAFLAEREIPLLTLKGQDQVLRNITPAAEHSWALLLACARGLLGAADHVKSGGWDRNQFPGVMLRGRTLGVIGCGRLGTWMSRYASAFGMNCLGYDPFVDPWPETIQKSDLPELLGASDFVTIHVHFTEETRGLLGPQEFAQMKQGAVLINTSRGQLIDEPSLLAALKEGRLAGAGLDVLTNEPDVTGDPLVEYAKTNPRVVITPHIGGFSPDALDYVLSFCCERITANLKA